MVISLNKSFRKEGKIKYMHNNNKAATRIQKEIGRQNFLASKSVSPNTELGWNVWDWHLTSSSALMILKYKSLPQPRPYFMDITEQIKLFPPPFICLFVLFSCKLLPTFNCPFPTKLIFCCKILLKGSGLPCLAMMNYLFLKGLCASTYTCATAARKAALATSFWNPWPALADSDLEVLGMPSCSKIRAA
ncbi:hypothetical protein OIU79_016838 [Salix purpurea]|uniref:Uncharacterized protein n=1 Tax=Salix purpurea TaxID=77065 RepID=A0A9Q0PFQ9_SALPP|nr:hypothetical protein OIU79_016838 [Salix purpurea]